MSTHLKGRQMRAEGFVDPLLGQSHHFFERIHASDVLSAVVIDPVLAQEVHGAVEPLGVVLRPTEAERRQQARLGAEA